MTETIMQCCYTNAVKEAGGKISSGWQAVVVSEGLPSEAYANCVNLQNANSALQSHMVDEQGNVLNLFEVTGDGAYVYVSRTQYGLTDRLGRPNMFSHAYIFSWKQEEILRDPNAFLTLTADNFAKDEESARRPRSSLERCAPFTLERALERAGLTDAGYLALIQCVYARYMERKAVKPVFVQYDGSEEGMQALLYCIYYSLPYCVRRSLSAASTAANTTKNHHLIFSTSAAGHESYVIPQTGENNVLTARTQRRIARCGFVDHVARNWRGGDADGYFRRLEQAATELGDAAASDELILKIAHQLIQDPAPPAQSDEELAGSLSDALRSRAYGSERMEEYISVMLDEACRRRISLTGESAANLARWLAAPVTARLPDAGERYNIYALSTLPEEEAAARLNELPPAVFQRYSHTLEHSGGGLKILDRYYAEYGLADREITWAALEELLVEASYVRGAVRVKDRLDAEAWKLYDAQLDLDRPGQAPDAYRALMRLMRGLLTCDELGPCGETAKEHFWERVTPENFSYSRAEEYGAMDCQCAACRRYLDACGVLRAYGSSDGDAFLLALNRYANTYADIFDERRAANDHVEMLERELRGIDPQAQRLSGWIDAVSIPQAGAVLDDILALRGQLRRQDYPPVPDTFQRIMEGAPAVSGNRLVRIVTETAVEECQMNDTPQRYVPIDVWLALGASLYPGHAFWIFDKREACVTQADVDAAQAAGESSLLGTPAYLEQAEDYVQTKGECARAVHRWLGERKAAERRRRSEEKAQERRQRKETDGTVLDRGLAFFSQLTGGGEGGRRLAGSKGDEAPRGAAPFRRADPSDPHGSKKKPR